jgi:hypothetical protein
MSFTTITRLAGVAVLAMSLAGCIDMTAEVEVLSETEGRATTVTTMGAEFYPMIKAMAAMGQAPGATAPAPETEGFCEEEGDELTENEDQSATCTSVKEGLFADLKSAGGPTEDATFTVVSPGVVRLGFKTESLEESATEGQDAETQAMMMAYFDGHNATLRIKGNKIVDSNMTISADGTTAEVVIPFTQLMTGTAELPEELYAVVDTR